MRVWYRLRQAASRATAGVRPLDTRVARQVLPTEGWALFEAMPRAEQEHALRVHAQVSKGPLALQQAALLHDVGKADGRIRLWHRAAHVLLRQAPAGLADRVRRWRHAEGLNWLAQHPSVGAALCAEAGLGEDVCRLVALHDEREAWDDLPAHERARLAALRRADDAC